MKTSPCEKPGPFLCRIDAIPDGEARGFPLPGESHPRAVLVVRQGSKIYGYRNRCPHQGTPLDWTPDRFFNLEKTHLQCATHGAQFQVEDGHCIAGPCLDKTLERVSLRVEGGKIHLDIPHKTPKP
ncbi:Rieske (2Fe-2S) protein [Rhodospirillaceae bacterium AH-315-P19]|nr:Rieske (2Fe-2S) protein [Rhodospirillaceae bacterium AH-315-P19]